MAIARTDETDLLLPLYDGVHEAAPWTTFLIRLRQRVRADWAALVVGNEAGGERSFVTSTDAATRIDRNWRRRLRPGRAYPLEYRFGRIVRADEPGGASAWLAIGRGERDVTAADGALLTRLAPHLASALRMLAAFDAAESMRTVAAAAADRAGVGWIAFASDGRVLAMSEQTSAALGARWNPSGVAAAVADCAGRRTAMTLRLPAGAPGGMQLIALPESPALARTAVIGLLSLPWQSDTAAQAQALITLFGLAPSEARLAAEIAGGASLSEAADRLGVTIETARNYSKRVFAKTRTRGQADLVRRIGQSAARFA